MEILANLVKSILHQAGVDYLPRLVTVDFLDQRCVVRNGVVDDGDYDDAWMLALALHAQTIFDIGSNIGQSAFNMLHAPCVKQIILVDPSPFALTIAADTLIRNQMSSRVHFLNAYVADTSHERVRFNARGYSTGAKALKQPSQPDTSVENIQVPTITIDDIVNTFNIRPDFVKLDVDGLEEKVLAGGEYLASQQTTRFMIEMHSTDRPQTEVTQKVLDWCDTVNYAAWYMKDAVRITSPDPVQHRGRYHLLLQPESWDYPDWLASIAQGAPVQQALQTAKS